MAIKDEIRGSTIVIDDIIFHEDFGEHIKKKEDNDKPSDESTLSSSTQELMDSLVETLDI